MKIRTTRTRLFRSLILAATAILLLPGTDARTWTSADGAKTFEGELKTYDPATGMVGVTLPTGKLMKFSQKVLFSRRTSPSSKNKARWKHPSLASRQRGRLMPIRRTSSSPTMANRRT